jgi:CDGSH-type Zn-finger protein
VHVRAKRKAGPCPFPLLFELLCLGVLTKCCLVLQPLCDGAHKGTGLKPLRMVAEEDGTLFLCGCKHTTTGPFCDGTHAKYAGW